MHSTYESTKATLPCTHCGLPTPVAGDADPQCIFCCSGCRGAYELINGWGLSEFYALRDQMSPSDTGQNLRTVGKFEAFDNDEFLGTSRPKQMADGLMATELALHGLHCGACAWLIENAANQTNGWQIARVRMSDHTIRIVFDSSAIKLSAIARLLAQLGYEVAPLTATPDDHYAGENRRLITQIAIAGFCAANAMWIAIALYAGEASGVAASHWLFLRIFGTILGLASVVGPGRTFFRGAIASIKIRTPHMDLPVALGLAAGTTIGIWNVLSGQGAVYFDSLAVLVFLLLIGRWIQFRQQHRAALAVDLLLRITPRHARRVVENSNTNLVLVDNLVVGDIVRVSAGESIPVDGIIVSGESTIDRSLLTGESIPVAASKNDNVSAGTTNITAPIDLCVQAIGASSRIGKVMQAVEAAASEKTPIVHLADRIGGVFVVVVTLLAIVTAFVWLGEGWDVAAENATSLLIVACPCALALATPLAIAVSLGRAAQRKILIRDGASIQLLGGTGTIWFDKTGTLTEGRPRIVELFGDETALRHAAAIERDCNHPLADGIVRETIQRGISIPVDARLNTVHTGGISGESEKHAVVIGNALLMKSRRVELDATMQHAIKACLLRGLSPIVIGLDQKAVAVAGMSDPLRADAAKTVDRLRNAGWHVGILSGDNCEIVQRVAKELSIDSGRAIGELSPEDKLAIVKGSRRDGRSVVMVGDGANDAAALAVADVGIAVRGGAEVSLQAAPVYISSGKLSTIADLFRSAKSTNWLIYTTFAVSLSYNLIAVTLAATGNISPLIAAILMPISSVSVLAITLCWPTMCEENP